jgi:phage tail P2-like protein
MPDDLLPPNATSQERDISLAVNRLPDVPIKTLWSPATCPEAQLPWLAWALSVDDWDATWPVETKREVVAASIDQHRKKGTVGALRRALQRLGYEVEIDEATGVAYTFRLRVRIRAGDSAGGSVAEDALNRSVTVALRQKNARSELLDTLYVADTDPAGLFIGGVTMSGLSYEAKETEDYTLPPSDLVIEQADIVNSVNASWTGTGEYYQIEIRSLTGELVSGGNAYSEAITDLSVLHGDFIFNIRSFADGRFSSWLSEPFTISAIAPTDITADTSSAGVIVLACDGHGYFLTWEIRINGDTWANAFAAVTDASGYATFFGLSADFYDVRVRAEGMSYPSGTVYSNWTELLNIEVN